MMLEPGIWYEQPRNRYRVRLYKKGQVVHLSYHKDLASAQVAKEEAEKVRASVVTDRTPKPFTPNFILQALGN